MFDWGYGQGWSEDQKRLHRIERLLEEEIKLLRRISSQLPPALFDAPGPASMEFVVAP
jgi:hypothetical protein